MKEVSLNIDALTERDYDDFYNTTKDFKVFCPMFLMIKDEAGKIIPFILNELQLKVLDYILEGLKSGVSIRLLILKCRQTGISTLIEGIFFWISLMDTNQKMLIIGHEKKASVNLFEMLLRYLDNIEDGMRPTIDTNQKEKKIKRRKKGILTKF